MQNTREVKAASCANTNTSNMSTEVSELYAYYCKECECKVNTSLHNYLRHHVATTRSLVSLSLSNNYLGSKGLRPVWKLLQHCDALRELNVEGNGLDNECVQEMCHALCSHLFLETINLNNNPISATGGRILLEFVKEHPSLIQLFAENTDMTESLLSRLQTALEVNRFQSNRTDKPQLIAMQNTNDLKQATSESSRKVLCPLPPPRNRHATLELIQSSKSSQSTHSQVSSEKHKDELEENNITKDNKSNAHICTQQINSANNTIHDKLTNGNKVPLPALATKEKSIAPKQQMSKLSSEFANLLTHDGAISVKTDNSLIGETETNNNKNVKQIDDCENGVENCKTDGSKSNNKTKITNEKGTHDLQHLEEEEQEEELCHNEIESFTERCEGADNDKASSKQENENSSKSNNDNVHGTVTKATKNNNASVLPPPETESEEKEKTTVRNVKELTCLSTREQFQALFAQGCREYGVHHLDAAYVAWNEAMQLALKTRNREWMAVLSNNLQQLSYELLVEEGQAHLSSHELEQADGCFAMALDVAHKAHNAQWEKTMTEARTNVQEAVFFKCHEAALSLFTKAQEVWMIKCERRKMNALNAHYHNTNNEEKHTNTNTRHTAGVKDETVNQREINKETLNDDSDDQFFLLPGTDVMVAHTNQFIDTWEWILLVQEAVRTWSEAARVARKIRNKATTSSSHTSFMPHSNYSVPFDKTKLKKEEMQQTNQQTMSVYTLSEMINNELTNVACFLVSRFFDMSRPEATQNELCWQYTSCLHYHECILLSEVLWDMLSYSDQYLHHAAFACVVSLQLGNLYVASHQLSLAERQFTNVITCGQELQEPLFIASGLFFAALLNYQRANYAQAEHFLGEALVWWERIRNSSSSSSSDVSVQSTEVFTSSSAHHNITAFDNNNNNNNSNTKMKELYLTKLHVLLLSAIPAHYISVMHNACYRLLIQVCVNTFRYREALEVLESSLVQSTRDELYHKLSANFTIQPTLDQIAGISITLHSPLLYYFLHRQYDWDDALHGYRVEEHILIWAVPECAELKFVDVNVSNDFNISVTSLIRKIRCALHLNPFMSSNHNENNENNVEGDMIVCTEHFPHSTWIVPLQTLYTILVSPVKEYVKALCSTPQDIDSVWTIIPCEELRLVPFNALISTPLTERINNVNNYTKEIIPYYWIEEVALQMELSATHGAFNALSALRLYKHNEQTHHYKLNSDNKESKVASSELLEEKEDHVRVQVAGRPVRDLIVLQPAGELPIFVEQHLTTSSSSSSSLSELHSTFEFDNTRCATEGNVIQETWRTAAEEYKQYLAHMSCKHHIAELCKAISPIVVDEINLLRQLLPQVRLLHIAAGVVSLGSNELSNNVNGERRNNSTTSGIMADLKNVNILDNKAVTLYNNQNKESDFDICNNISRNSNESYGALVVGGMHPELSLLTSYELGQLELTAPLAICSSTHLSEELMRNDVDGAMSIVRAFHSAQIPSVILSQWCTPDMKPSELFTLFYKELFHTIYALHQNNNQIKYIDRDYLLNTNYQLSRDITHNINSDNDKYSNNTSIITSKKNNNTHYHQPTSIAVLLAHAIRLILHNSSKPAACDDLTVDLRYCPRKWAAYYCLGCGASDLV